MYCLSCVSITKPLALASLPTNNDSHPIQTKHTKLPMHTTEPKTTLPLPLPLPRKKKQQQQHKRQQPTIAQIERAIGAGRYRDIDARDLDEEDMSEFDLASMSFDGKFEGPVEKKLRETGEQLNTWTETEFRASGKNILMFVFQWILPIWTLSVLVASGVIKLPFSTPFDELIM
ncbi:probable NAD(P)H dehydrogenase subunit CRR3, chloroplastic [Fagus crenata]